jgi:uncharacterized protein (TIGR02302 family)
MTPYSKPTIFRTGWKTDRVSRAIGLARGALFVERGLPAAAWALGLIGLFIALALFQAYAFLPWTLHAFVLALFITAIGLSLYFGFRSFAAPGWNDGARKVERDSALQHRPLSEADDTLALGAGDVFAETLWRAHVARRLAEFPRLKVSSPHPDMQSRDPHRLRYALGGVLLVGVILAGTDTGHRLLAAFGPSGLGSDAGLDAWIDPPAYTGLAPIYLSRLDGPLSVPIGSTLNLRVHGATRTPGLMLWGDNEDAHFAGNNGEYASTARIRSNGDVTVRANGRTIGNWDITIIPDNKPSIGFAANPTRTERDAVNFSFAAKDDYGVTAVRAMIKPRGKPGKDLIVDIPLPSLSAKSLTVTRAVDLTEHPYAGLDVNVTLEARDGAGQTGSSKTVQFRLPARVFINPLARALVEQRQILATADASGRSRVARILDALTFAPDKFYPDQLSIYTAVRAAFWALRDAKRDAEIAHVQDLLWQTANAIERGGLANAAEELRRIQQQLSQALMQGAEQETIDELMRRYNEAMQRYLRALAENPTPPNLPSNQGNPTQLTEKDLDALMKAIQEMSQSGAREQAERMLAMLQNLLENLRMAQSQGQGGQGQQGEQSAQQKALSDAVQGLSGMMGKQRGLMDRSFRREQGMPGDNPQGMSQEQGALRDQLNKALQELRRQGQNVPGAMDRAARAMEQAQQNLGQDNMADAGAAQKDALDQLRQAAEELSKDLMASREQNGQGQQGREDPLGRAQNNGAANGNEVKVPTASDLQRARSILQELRKRAAERGRPQEELDYIDRLLKQF